MMTLQDRIRTRREAAGLTQQEAADRANLSRQHWNQIETGRRRDPRWSTVCRIADALGCEIGGLR